MKIEEEELVAGLKSGADWAISYLYEHYSDALYGVAYRICPPEENAQDILQDAFVKIWKNIRKYDPKKGRLYTWMVNILRNTAIDRLRKEKKSINVEIQNDGADVYSLNNLYDKQKPEHIGVLEMLDKLDEGVRETAVYIYIKGFTQQEVSDELALPLGTVKTRARIALRELRKYFDLK